MFCRSAYTPCQIISTVLIQIVLLVATLKFQSGKYHINKNSNKKQFVLIVIKAFYDIEIHFASSFCLQKLFPTVLGSVRPKNSNHFAVDFFVQKIRKRAKYFL